jgi:transcriptional regulator with GAF, ATPase, and Fis domain
LKEHIKSVHEGAKYKCTECDYETTKTGNFQRHKKSNHGAEVSDSLLCKECSVVAESTAALKKHVEEHNPFAVACSQCDFKTKNRKLLNSHVSVKHSTVCLIPVNYAETVIHYLSVLKNT